MRPALAHRLDESRDQIVVFVTAKAFVLPADIERIAQVLLVVGAGVEQDRQCRSRMQPGAGGVERQLADRNPHTAGALIAETENPFAVADHDRLNMIVARMKENPPDQILVRNAQKQSAGFTENMAKELATEPDRRRVDDRHHLFDVAGQQSIKQCLVGILQTAQKDIALEIAAKPAKGSEAALNLVVELGDMRRQKPVQVEGIALAFVERCPLVEQRVVEKLIAAQRGFDMGPERSGERRGHAAIR